MWVIQDCQDIQADRFPERINVTNSKEAKNALKVADCLLNQLDKGLISITGFALVALALMIFVDVCMRFIFNCPLPASAEATELAMPYITFGTLAYTLALGKHIRISAVVDHVPNKLKMVCEILTCVIGIFFCGLMTLGGWNFFWESFIIRENMLAIVKLPWWVGKFIMPVGFFLMMLRFIYNLACLILKSRLRHNDF